MLQFTLVFADKPSVYLAARSFAENYKSKLNELDLMDLTSYFTSSGKQPNFLKVGSGIK